MRAVLPTVVEKEKPERASARRLGILQRLQTLFHRRGNRSNSEATEHPETLDPSTTESVAKRPLDTEAQSKDERPDGYDTLGSELDENARLWKVFRTEVTTHDQEVTIYAWNATLDVLLVFAALFLGVVTSFVIQVYPTFSGKGGTQPDSEPQSGATPSLAFLVMMGLWLASLMVALIVSLFCILAKQWLGEYTRRLAENAADARLWARRRWIYMHGLEMWKVGLLATDGLPLLLHISLFLFAVGLVILLSDLQGSISWLVGTLTGVLLAAYIACTFFPVYWVDSPTATPLLSQIRALLSRRNSPSRTLAGSGLPARDGFMSLLTRPRCRTEDDCIRFYAADMEHAALHWLLTVSRSDEALIVAFSAVSALPQASTALQRVLSTGVGLADAFQCMRADSLRAIDVMRVIRSELHLRPGHWNRARLGLDIPKSMLDRLQESESADAGVLFAAMQKEADLQSIAANAARWRDLRSSSLSSTIGLLLRCSNVDARAILYLMLPLNSGDICKLYPAFAEALNRKWTYGLARRGSPSAVAPVADRANPALGKPACAIALLVQISAKMICSYGDFKVAAQLAARVVTILNRRDMIPTFVQDAPWDPQLETIHSKAAEIFDRLHSNDPVLGWCRTMGRVLRVLVSQWVQDITSQGYIMGTAALGHRVGFILESLLRAYTPPTEATIAVREEIVSILLVTFLQNTAPIEHEAKPECCSHAVAWEHVHKLKLRHTTLLQLATILSAALCLFKRAGPLGNKSDLIRVFLSGDTLRLLLSESSRAERIGPADTYVHLAQHCVELHGSWCVDMRGEENIVARATTGTSERGFEDVALWFFALRRARGALPVHVPSSDHASIRSGEAVVYNWRLRAVTRYILAERLEHSVTERGPCRSCAGTPPVWPRGYPRAISPD